VRPLGPTVNVRKKEEAKSQKRECVGNGNVGTWFLVECDVKKWWWDPLESEWVSFIKLQKLNDANVSEYFF